MTDMYKASAEMDREKKTKLIDELLARHGIAEDIPAKIQKLLTKDPKEAVKTFITVGAALKDRVAFLEDMARLIPKVDERGNNPFNDFAGATIKDVRIDGDRASGQVILRPTVPDRSRTFFFRMEEGAWKMDLVRTVEENAVREKKDK